MISAVEIYKKTPADIDRTIAVSTHEMEEINHPNKIPIGLANEKTVIIQKAYLNYILFLVMLIPKPKAPDHLQVKTAKNTSNAASSSF